MPSDAQRLGYVMALLGHGKTDRVLMSHDIHTKHRLVEYGGHGFSHIINNILPRLVDRDVSDADLETITVENPKNWLQFDVK
jgi:phosphotriesterase-related protein